MLHDHWCEAAIGTVNTSFGLCLIGINTHGSHGQGT